MVGSALAVLVVSAAMSSEPPSEAVVHGAAGLLEWHAPPECPQSSAVEARLTEFLGEPITTRPGAHSLRAVGVVQDRGESGGYLLRLQLFANGAVDERTIDGPRCDELAVAFALVVAVTLDPISAATTVQVRTRNPVSEPPPAVDRPGGRKLDQTGDADQRAPSDPPAADASEPSRTPLAIAPFGHIAMAYGPVRAPAAAVHGGLGLLVTPGLRFELGARHRFGSLAGTDVSTRITTTTATAAGCAIPRARRLEFPICLGVELGAIRASDTQGLAETRAVRSLWSAAALGARILWPVRSWLAVGAHASGLVSYTPVIFGIDDDDRTVFRSLPVGALVGLAIEGRISVTKSRGPGQ